MMRMAGSVLLFLSFAWLGLHAARELRRKTALLEELLAAVEQLRRELDQSLTPLPELLEGIGTNSGVELNRFFRTCAQRARKPDPSFAAGWNEALEILRQDLDERTQRCMQKLGNGLGRYDVEAEGRLLSAAEEELRECLSQRREYGGQRCKLYRTLGMTAGAVCLILCW